MSTKIHDLDVVLLKNGKKVAIVYVHDPKIQPQGYEAEVAETNELLTITDADIEKVLHTY